MNKLFIAAALVATSFSALAENIADYTYRPSTTPGVSRAGVRAELARAAANGELVSGERSYVAPVEGRALSRAEVRAALDNARRNNELARGEFSYGVNASAGAPVRLAGR